MKMAKFLMLLMFFCSATMLQAGSEKISRDKVYPVFAIGPSGVYATIEKNLVVTVAAVQDGTPAADSGLQVGDVLLSVAGKSLAVADPRVPLGRAIGQAEAKNGKLVFQAQRGSKKKKFTVLLPKLGAYSSKWPADCKKSAAIVAATAKYVVASQQSNGGYKFGNGRAFDKTIQACLSSLFLLSTGEDKYLPNVQRHVYHLAALAEKRRNAGGHVNWQLGYQGILLSEYYLRTGDKRVLPGLQELCNWCIENQAAGGWSHGQKVGPGYVQSGLMNHAGIPILTTLVLAQECGVKVDKAAYGRAMNLIYRMIGHGCISYGDHRGELWWSNTNGRNGMVACTCSLLSDIPKYKQASEHLALLVTDSYFQPEFGHTGGGFNVIWRGMSSVHVPKKKVSHYYRQMKYLAWYYDLCRQPGGGFSMLTTPPDNKRYTGLEWGTGAIGLTYTAPLAKLRITGAPRSKYSKKVRPPSFVWGNRADTVFFGTDGAKGFRKEIAEPHEVYALLLKDRKQEVSVDFCAYHLRHYSPLVRTWAARRLCELKTPAALRAIGIACEHSDARVRRAAFDAISGYDNWGRPMRVKLDSKIVSRNYLPSILRTLGNSKSAWWEVDGALFALGRAEPADIRKQLPMILKYSKHKDWYVRESAFWAIVGLHETIRGNEFEMMSEIYEKSRHVFERMSYDAGYKVILKQDRVAIDRLSMAKTIKRLGKVTTKPQVMLGYGASASHEAAHRTMVLLKHFNPEVYPLLIKDFTTYLRNWEPYHQHAGWMISGSKWQPGILSLLDGYGKSGQPIVTELKRLLKRYPKFDKNRYANESKGLEEKIVQAVKQWEEKHGKAR